MAEIEPQEAADSAQGSAELQGGGGHGGGNERWLVSYADFITLLMVFFVILYSMANVDKNKFQQVAHSLSEALGGGRTLIVVDGGAGRNGTNFVDPTTLAGTISTPTEDVSKGDTQGDNSDPLTHLGQDIQPKLAEATNNQVRVAITPKGLRISLLGNALFDSGRADIKPQAQKTLAIVADAIKKGGYYASIEGSADNQPIRTAQFEDNWDLASTRALNVLHYLSKNFGIAQDRLYLASYGEFHPIVPNDTAQGRQMNRRVDIVVMDKPQPLELGTEIKAGQ